MCCVPCRSAADVRPVLVFIYPLRAPVSIGQAALGLPTDARAITRPKNDWIRAPAPDEVSGARRAGGIASDRFIFQTIADGWRRYSFRNSRVRVIVPWW